MTLGVKRSLVYLLVAFVLTLSAPLFAHAFGKEADAMCNPVQPVCGCGQVMGPKGCTAGANKFMCPCFDTTAGFTTSGVCIAQLRCQAQGTSDGTFDKALGALGQILGQVLGKLGQGSGSGSGSGSTPYTPPATTGCTGTYFQTSDITQLSNPCAQYVPPTTPIDTGGGTSTCDTLSQLLGTCTGGGDTGGSVFTADPVIGTAPLTVTFSSRVTGQGGAATIQFGDGVSEQATSCNAPADVCITPGQNTHIYQSAGSYTATLVDSTGATIGNVTVTVNSAAVGGSTITTVLTDNSATTTAATTTPNTADLSGLGSPLLLAPGLNNGVAGDILLLNGGATIYSSSQNLANNTGVAGFFGSDTFNGQQPQGIAAQMCQARPWAGGFWGSILPVSFFDGLCSARGYQVGPPPTPSAPVVQLQQTTPAPKPAAPAPAATSTTPSVKPVVQIWAVPSSVPLATRTSIFWNTQGVTECTETSPDGSFNQNSLSGGAATVPLTNATTFTISCLDADGNPVTSYVTVNLSI